jgi:hypothetical protein
MVSALMSGESLDQQRHQFLADRVRAGDAEILALLNITDRRRLLLPFLLLDFLRRARGKFDRPHVECAKLGPEPDDVIGIVFQDLAAELLARVRLAAEAAGQEGLRGRKYEIQPKCQTKAGGLRVGHCSSENRSVGFSGV